MKRKGKMKLKTIKKIKNKFKAFIIIYLTYFNSFIILK